MYVPETQNSDHIEILKATASPSNFTQEYSGIVTY